MRKVGSWPAQQCARALGRRHAAACQWPGICSSYCTASVNHGNPDALALAKCKRALESIAEKLNIKEVRVKRKKVSYVLFESFSSLKDALRAVYPHYSWDPRLFTDKGRHSKEQLSNKNALFQEIVQAEPKIGIKQPEDWYSVTMTDLRGVGFPQKIRRTEVLELLSARYPNQIWNYRLLLKGRFGQQRRLESAIASLFPNQERLINARKEAKLTNPETGEWLELDIYIPSLNIAFEYHELHHYTSVRHSYKPVEAIRERDKMKKEVAAANGITLITVPCWWDNRLESLTATIQKERPDVFPDAKVVGEGIPEEMPPNFLEKHVDTIEGIGQPTTACFFTLSNVNPTNWWMFEKYDGVRGFWNPEKKAFFSRTGNQFAFPDEVIDSMPNDIFLDGELWFGKENFEESMKIVHRMKDKDIDWSKFKYMVFDVPNFNGTYEERYNHMVKQLGANREWKYIQIANMEVCKDTVHLEKFYQDVVDRGGEGIILRNPAAQLQPGRCPGYLKHKKFRDAEAKIVASTGPSEWECELPNGVTFVASAGTTEFAKRWNPQPGDIVSFKHHGYLLGSKKPKFPTLHRLRSDIAWDDVVHNWKEQKPSKNGWLLRRSDKLERKPKGYWANQENRRKFFTQFAEEHNFDPLKIENWTKVNTGQMASKQAIGLVYRFGTLSNALKKTFPEMKFKHEALFWKKRKEYWKDPANCRLFLQEFAKDARFNPLDPHGWAHVTRKQLAAKEGTGLLDKYGTLRDALKTAFPETFSTNGNMHKISLAKLVKNRKVSGSYWESIQNCRQFFDGYARERGLDPLSAATWYHSMRELQRRKEKNAIKQHHGGMMKALHAAYPEITFARWSQKLTQ